MKMKELNKTCTNCGYDLIIEYIPVKVKVEEEGYATQYYDTTKKIAYVRCPACGKFYVAREEQIC